MANTVEIEVQARVGDAIAQMTLTAGAVRLLADEADNAGASIGSESDGRSLSGRIGGLRRALSNIGDRGPLGMVVRGFGNLASAMLAPLDLGMKFADNFERLGSVTQVFVGILASLPIALTGAAAAVAIFTFAATGLADILGTIVAIAADFVAPLTLVGGLLGGLGLGFAIAAKRATEGGHHFKDFNDKLATLGSMFHRTGTLLAQRFLPYFEELAGAAKHALLFLDRIIKLPLGQAFRAIDTQGTKMLGRFVDRVSEVLSKPIRLAFHVAFEDTAFSAMVSDWWHRFTGFLFGEVERKPIRFPNGRIITIEKHQVDGIFQPLVDWFNRHHFTKQGIQIGHQILDGFLTSPVRHRITTFIVQIFRDSARQAGHAFLNMLNQPLGPLLLDLVKRTWNTIDRTINNAGHQARQYIISQMQSAWNSVKDTASRIWDWIVDKITSPLSINIDWPSPPSWFTSWLGGGGPSVPGRGGGGGTSNPTGGGNVARAVPRAAMAAPFVQVNIHGADLSDGPTQRRVAQKIGKAVASDWRRRAGGH